MLFLVFFTTTFVAVISDSLLGVSYYFDVNYFDYFHSGQCVHTTEWNLVSYGNLEIEPPYEESSLAIRSSKNSCIVSFPIVFLGGTLEVTVLLRTVSKYSGLTISVFDDRDEALVSVRYQRSNKNFIPGWTIVSVPIKNHTTGYVQISGQSLNTEIVLVDSLRYKPDDLVYSLINEETQSLVTNQLKNTPPRILNRRSIPDDQFIFALDEVGSREGDIEEGSGESATEPSITDNPSPNTEDPDVETENPDADSSTEEPEENIENPGDGGVLNIFTIILLIVGVLTVVGFVAVCSYYLGKNRSISEVENRPLDLEVVTPIEMIPRARSVFSETTYDTRFST